VTDKRMLLDQCACGRQKNVRYTRCAHCRAKANSAKRVRRG
jgi:hypothetical protein